MSAVIVVYADGLFCDSSHDVPNTEPDLYALRWYTSLYDGSSEQFVIACDSPHNDRVGSWLRMYDAKFSAVLGMGEDDVEHQQRCERIVKFVAAQQSKLVLYIGARFYDCNWMADIGIPSLRYTPPNRTGKQWEPDPRNAWVKAIAKQQS